MKTFANLASAVALATILTACSQPNVPVGDPFKVEGEVVAVTDIPAHYERRSSGKTSHYVFVTEYWRVWVTNLTHTDAPEYANLVNMPPAVGDDVTITKQHMSNGYDQIVGMEKHT
jgi:hypothetical protein